MQTRAELYEFLGYYAYEQKLDELFAAAKQVNWGEIMATTTDRSASLQTEEIRRALRHAGRQHGDVHRRPNRQRSALSRLRHRRSGRACEFEEVAYLLLCGKLPNATELAAYKQKLNRLRGLPANVYEVLEQIPAATHPMDVLRTGVSALGCTLPEKDDHSPAGAIECADVLLATFGSMLLYWYHYSRNGQRIEVDTGEDTLAGHFLSLLHGEPPSKQWMRAMQVSLGSVCRA